MSLYDDLFGGHSKPHRMIGKIVAISSVGFSVQTVKGEVIQVKGGNEYNIDDSVLIVNGFIEQKTAELPQMEIVV